MFKLIRIITLNNIKNLKKSIIATIVRSTFQSTPYAFLLMIILELLKPLENLENTLNLNKLYLLLFIMLITFIIEYFISNWSFLIQYNTGYELGAKGRLFLGNHIRKLPMGFYKNRNPGDITSLMLSDYTHVETLASHLILDIINAFIFPLILAIFLLFINPTLTFISLIPIPIAIFFTFFSKKIINFFGKKLINIRNLSSSRILEYLEGIKNIKSFYINENKLIKMRSVFNNLRKMSIKLESAIGPIIIFGNWFLNFGIAIIMLVGIQMLFSFNITITHYIIFLVSGTRMYEPLSRIMIMISEMAFHTISINRIDQVLNEKTLVETKNPKIIENYDITFNQVSFSYENRKVLENINFKIKEKSITALVGPSGSGKSTITKLIPRFWDVIEGEIKIGGINIKNFSQEYLLKQISIVFQDVYLFNDTVFENIKIGNKKSSYEEVISAAKESCCHEFIELLPKSYNTIIGESGSTISGGEAQRISIARAILKNAPIILFDEITSFQDLENEHYIQLAINKLVKNKTLIIIAHRLNTIKTVDQILVLDKGKILEYGTHKKLIKENGLYANMLEKQEKNESWKI